MDLATLALRVDSTGAVRAVDGLNRALDANVKQATKTEKAMAALNASLKIAAATGFAAVGLGIRKMLNESVAAQKVQAQLAAGLASTGKASGQTVASLNAMSASLQKVSTFGDEAIGTSQSLLLTFTKIGGDVFPRATQAIVDMATRMGTDLNSAAIQVGKALNDPILGVSALTRVGVQFSTEQKTVIERLVETNQLAAAQAVILKELEVQFGGSAAAARNTLGGALAGLSNAWGDLFEVSQESSSGMIRAINRITEAIPGVRDAINRWVVEFEIAGTKFAITNAKIAIAFGSLQSVLGAIVATGTKGTAGLGLQAAGAVAVTTAQAELGALRKLLEEQRIAFVNAGRAASTAATDYQTFTAAVSGASAASGGPRRPGASNIALGARGTPLGGGLGINGTTIGVNGTNAQREADRLSFVARIRAEMESSARTAEQITKNFLENVQGSLGSFFTDIFTNGTKSFANLWDSFKRLALDAIGQIAAKNVIGAIFGGAGGAAGGLLGGLSGGTLGLLAGAGIVLGGIFGGRRRPRTPASQTPSYPSGENAERARQALAGANGFDAARENAVQQSVGGILTQSSASEIVANLRSIRLGIVQLVQLAQQGAMGGSQVTVNGVGGGADAAGVGAQAAAALDRLLGATQQRLRLQSGTATLG